MGSTYGRSPGGYIWAVLEPAAGIFLLVTIFSLMVRIPPLGTNFAMFYASGLVPFLFYMSISSKMASAIQFSRQLLFYPRVTFIDALVARFLLETITQFLVAYVILAGLFVFSGFGTMPDLADVALAFSMAAAFAFGVGVLNCFLTTQFPVWQRIWAITNRPLLIISGIIFLFDSIPEPYRGYLWFNPIMHFIGQMRHAFYPYYEATYVSPLYVFAVSLVLCVFGLVFLLRYNRDLLNF